jgi:hypothetical protein
MVVRDALGFGAAALMIAAFAVWIFSGADGKEGGEKGDPVLESRPDPLPSDPGEEEKRAELLRMRSALCKDLQLLGAVILNVGILPRVPPRIMEITGMPIDDLEAEETAICGQIGPPEAMSSRELIESVRTVEWLNRIHLEAMVFVTDQDPSFRPIDATGAYADFFRLHDVIVKEMLAGMVALQQDGPTVDEARALDDLWAVVIDHALAEEESLWPLVRGLDVPQLRRSAELLDEEHRQIETLIAVYRGVRSSFEAGEADAAEVIRAAESVRLKVGLHFAKEEQSVIRPMQQMRLDEKFEEVILSNDRAIGPWLKEHGWICETCS